MILPAEAVEAAQQGLNNLGLQTNASIASALDGAHVGFPLLVKRLDEPLRGYYIVPWETEEGITLVVEVDALTGTMSGFVPLPQVMPSLVMNSEQAMVAVTKKLGYKPIGEPRLVWLPCRESSSPLRPFYQVKTDEGEVYVNMDSFVYTKLTPFEMGG